MQPSNRPPGVHNTETGHQKSGTEVVPNKQVNSKPGSSVKSGQNGDDDGMKSKSF